MPDPEHISSPKDFNIEPNDNLQMYDWLRDGEHPNGGHHPCHLPWLCVEEEFGKVANWPYEEMAEECKQLDDKGLIPDYNSGGNIGWSAIALYGLSSDSTLPPEEYGYSNYNEARAAGALNWTEIAEHCPVTTKFFKEDFNHKRYNRIRFMKLAPGGYIRWHHDTPEGEDSKFPLGVFNMALTNPDGCYFNMGMWGNLPVKPGTMWLFANEHYHCVYNSSDKPRYHIIVSGTPNEQFWAPVIANSFRKQWSGIYYKEIDGKLQETYEGN